MVLVVAATFVLYDTPPQKTEAFTDVKDTQKAVEVLKPTPIEPVAPKVETVQAVVEAPAPIPKTNREVGQELAVAKGWTGSQWLCLEKLWTNESNWDHTNYNGRSQGIPWNNNRATGIPQSLPASKMASHGADYMTNPATQIRWGLDYVQNRYGSPCAALSFWNSKSPHWY